jgi:hypothetical protein
VKRKWSSGVPPRDVEKVGTADLHILAVEIKG